MLPTTRPDMQQSVLVDLNEQLLVGPLVLHSSDETIILYNMGKQLPRTMNPTTVLEETRAPGQNSPSVQNLYHIILYQYYQPSFCHITMVVFPRRRQTRTTNNARECPTKPCPSQQRGLATDTFFPTCITMTTSAVVIPYQYIMVVLAVPLACGGKIHQETRNCGGLLRGRCNCVIGPRPLTGTYACCPLSVSRCHA